MDQEDKQKIVNLTQNQAVFFKSIITNRTITANASGATQTRFSGKIISGMKKEGLIEQMGKEGRRTQWSLTPEWEKKKEQYGNDIIALIDKIVPSKTS